MDAGRNTAGKDRPSVKTSMESPARHGAESTVTQPQALHDRAVRISDRLTPTGNTRPGGIAQQIAIKIAHRQAAPSRESKGPSTEIPATAPRFHEPTFRRNPLWLCSGTIDARSNRTRSQAGAGELIE